MNILHRRLQPHCRSTSCTSSIRHRVLRMRRAFDPSRFAWEGLSATPYKDDPGRERGMAWRGISRTTLVRGPFEVRYFEIAPGGFSSLEKHEHEHAVFAVRGRGRALIGLEIVELAPLDLVETTPWQPHRWTNP